MMWVGKPFECVHYNMIRFRCSARARKKVLSASWFNHSDWLTRFSALRENASHVSRHATAVRNRFRPLRTSRSTVHVVQDFDEETRGGRRPIRPLHLSKVHLSAHQSVGTETSDSGKTLGCGLNDARTQLEGGFTPASSTSRDRSGTILSPAAEPSHP